MIRKHNRRSLMWGIPAVAIQVTGFIAWRLSTGTGWMALGMFLIVLGVAVFTIGLAFYAKAKGRHPAWCITGFLSLPGLIALATLNDLAPELTVSQPHED